MLTIDYSIKHIVSQLGSGLVNPVAYDTAWVARVPKRENLNQPAFPQALQWLRGHQLKDGSWGTEAPVFAHGNTLSTLAALLALKQWNLAEDQDRIEKGVQSLWPLAEKLQQEPMESVGFELLLPSLEQEAKSYQLKIPYNIYQTYQAVAQKKQQMILYYQQKHGHEQVASWWYNLEFLHHNPNSSFINQIRLPNPQSMLFSNGSVMASPAATAYLLMKIRKEGQDIPKAYAFLEEVGKYYHYGFPHFVPIEQYELIWAVDYFIKGGIQATDQRLKPAIDLLIQFWEKSNNQGLGFSECFPVPDVDDTAVAMQILKLANYPVDVNVLLKWFNGTYFLTFLDERTSSISVNINTLTALRLFQDDPKIQTIIKKIVAWIKKEKNEVAFHDKWHFSTIYSTSRAIFALEGLDNHMVQSCINWLLQQQNPDGGWGGSDQQSTAEETAQAILALCFWHHKKGPIPDKVLNQAHSFLSQSEKILQKEIPLWIGKVLYATPLITASAIEAARYALNSLTRESR